MTDYKLEGGASNLSFGICHFFFAIRYLLFLLVRFWPKNAPDRSEHGGDSHRSRINRLYLLRWSILRSSGGLLLKALPQVLSELLKHLVCDFLNHPAPHL